MSSHIAHAETSLVAASDDDGKEDQRGFIAEGQVLDANGSSIGEKLGEHHVLLGRGLGTYNHIGNIKFRKLVHEHKMRYLACSKVDKPKIARELVNIWRNLDPPGRFLQRCDGTNDSNWKEVGDKKAQEKASQCLRERTPDVLPYYQFVRDRKRKATDIMESSDLSQDFPTHDKRRLRQDVVTSSCSAQLGPRSMPGILASDARLSAIYTGGCPVGHMVPGLSEHNPSAALAFLMNREIERKIALRQLLLQQLQTPAFPNLSLETILGYVPHSSNTVAKSLNNIGW